MLDIAAQPHNRQMIGLGHAARIAGLSRSRTVDEFRPRGIATIRIAPAEFDRKLASVRR